MRALLVPRAGARLRIGSQDPQVRDRLEEVALKAHHRLADCQVAQVASRPVPMVLLVVAEGKEHRLNPPHQVPIRRVLRAKFLHQLTGRLHQALRRLGNSSPTQCRSQVHLRPPLEKRPRNDFGDYD